MICKTRVHSKCTRTQLTPQVVALHAWMKRNGSHENVLKTLEYTKVISAKVRSTVNVRT